MLVNIMRQMAVDAETGAQLRNLDSGGLHLHLWDCIVLTSDGSRDRFRHPPLLPAISLGERGKTLYSQRDWIQRLEEWIEVMHLLQPVRRGATTNLIDSPANFS